MVSTSITWLTGDVIVVLAVSENAGTIALPTATGLTFVSQQLNTAAGTCASQGAAAIAGSGSSATVSCSDGAGAVRHGMGVWVWRGSDGIGTAAIEQHTATKVKSVTPADTHSAFCWTVADFSAAAVGAAVLTPTPTTVQESAQQASHFTIFSGNLNDQASAAAFNVGISGGTSVGPFSIVGIEVLGVTAPLVTTQLGGIGYG
jgi:hypothetical protein